MMRSIRPISTAEAQRRGRGGINDSSSRGRGRFRPTVKPRAPVAPGQPTTGNPNASTITTDDGPSAAAEGEESTPAPVQTPYSAPQRWNRTITPGATVAAPPSSTSAHGPQLQHHEPAAVARAQRTTSPPALATTSTSGLFRGANAPTIGAGEAPPPAIPAPGFHTKNGGGISAGSASDGVSASGPAKVGADRNGSVLPRPGSSFLAKAGSSAIVKPGSSLKTASSSCGTGGGLGRRSSSAHSKGGKDKEGVVPKPGSGAAGGATAGKRKGKGKELLPLTAEEVSIMKVADFCTSYKSRAEPKSKDKVAKDKASRAADSAKRKRQTLAQAGGAPPPPPPQAMKMVWSHERGGMVLSEENLIVEGYSNFGDENREEVDEDETTAATASSFTNRETPMRWKPHDVIKFYRGIQMYNLSFEMMAKMFNGERTAKQLKKKYEKELRDHPDMVHRALRVQITKDHPYFSENPPSLPNFGEEPKPKSRKARARAIVSKSKKSRPKAGEEANTPATSGAVYSGTTAADGGRGGQRKKRKRAGKEKPQTSAENVSSTATETTAAAGVEAESFKKRRRKKGSDNGQQAEEPAESAAAADVSADADSADGATRSSEISQKKRKRAPPKRPRARTTPTTMTKSITTAKSKRAPTSATIPKAPSVPKRKRGRDCNDDNDDGDDGDNDDGGGGGGSGSNVSGSDELAERIPTPRRSARDKPRVDLSGTREDSSDSGEGGDLGSGKEDGDKLCTDSESDRSSSNDRRCDHNKQLSALSDQESARPDAAAANGLLSGLDYTAADDEVEDCHDNDHGPRT